MEKSSNHEEMKQEKADENLRILDESSLLEHKYVKFVEKRMDLDHKNSKKLRDGPVKRKTITNTFKINTFSRNI